MEIKVEWNCPHDPEKIAEMINEISCWLESTEAPPNHWDERKRIKFYANIKKNLSEKSGEMCIRLAI